MVFACSLAYINPTHMKPKVRKSLKIFAIVFIILLCIVLAASWYVSCYLENRLHKTLTEQVDKQTNGLYKLKINKLSIELKKGVLHLCDITLQADSTKRLIDSIKSNLLYTSDAADEEDSGETGGRRRWQQRQ